jgi:hypothetical protein
MKASPSCRPETLLLGSSCDIQYCFDCKMLHLNVGSLTLRLSKKQYTELLGDMNQAATNLRHREMNDSLGQHSNVTTLHS